MSCNPGLSDSYNYNFPFFPPDIAVDWIAQNIYWSDPKENVIEVARLTGQYRYVLISGGVDQPSALAVDPESGYLFWSESGKIPLIARAGLDGKKQTILAQEIIMPIKDITLDRKVWYFLYKFLFFLPN